jgi:DNA-binding NarL/FixJ family response regulator
MDINPAGMTYERAFEIACEAYKTVTLKTAWRGRPIAEEVEVDFSLVRTVRIGNTSHVSSGRPVGKHASSEQRYLLGSLIGQGFSNNAIAREVGVSSKTVERWRKKLAA